MRVLEILGFKKLFVGQRLIETSTGDAYKVVSVDGSWIGVMSLKDETVQHLPAYLVRKAFKVVS